jgi:Flp pilus assembly protein TadG
MSKQRRSQRNRKSTGMGTVELAITAILGVLFACLAVDLGVMMLGNQLLDRATRDAARAAAGQSTLADAQQAARAALSTHKGDGVYVKSPTLLLSDFKYEDYGGTPQGKTIPAGVPGAGGVAQAAHVVVTATNEVLLPANLSWLMGSINLQQGPLATGKMPFRRTYWFPIVKSKLHQSFQ